MIPFTVETGALVPLERADIDTDQIIPKQFLKRIERTGFGPMLFHDWRFDARGSERPEFVLNHQGYRHGTILVAGRNFGCGSSREHAVWALQDHGFRVVIAPSFADIFAGNAGKVGLLTVVLPEPAAAQLSALARAQPGVVASVDLRAQMVCAGSLAFAFDIEPAQRDALLAGLDETAQTLRREQEISSFEARRPAWMPVLDRAPGLAPAPALRG